MVAGWQGLLAEQGAGPLVGKAVSPSEALGVEPPLYQRVGGGSFFVALIDAFYEGVEQDQALRPLYPADLGPGKAQLAAFLAQYWGGPAHYSAERGHPRLRGRHFPFPINQRVRDAWVGHMEAAIRFMGVQEREAAELREYFDSTATFLMNRAD